MYKNLLFLSLFLFSINSIESNAHKQVFTIGSKQIILEHGDITQSPCQCIINAANEQLAGGGGVCGAIFNAAGWNTLQQACNKYPATKGVRCPTGQARITDSFNLQKNGIQKIIHAVGPDCRIITDQQQQDTLLKGTYKNSLQLADQHNIKSIAFPFISSAIFAFPKDRAAQIALQTICDYCKEEKSNTVQIIYFVLFSKQDYDLFCEKIKNNI